MATLTTNTLSAGMRTATADCVAMASAIVLIALATWLFGGIAAQRIVTHAAILLTGVVALQIFSGNTGIVSFGHAGFMGFGAYVVGILTMATAVQSFALPQLPAFMAGREMTLAGALLVAVLLGLIAGTVAGLPLLRLSGSAASIATLALLIIIYTVLIAARDVTRGSQPFYGVPRNTHLWVAVPIAIAALCLARVFRETSWGLAARATANDEHGAAAVGIDRRAAVLATWVLSAVVATVAGGLMAQFLGAFTPHGFYFRLAFTLLATLIVGGMSSSLGALSGVILTTVLIELARRFESGVEVFGVTMPTLFGLPEAALAVGMLLIIWRRPEGLCRGFELDLVRRLGIQRPPVAAAALLPRYPGADSIRVEALTKRFAGLTAVDNVSIDIARNTITGIIGPNGAGKTTLLNLISGHAAATSGRIWIGPTAVEHAAAHTVARAGVARTFQNIRIFPRMSVFENALVAARQVAGSLRVAEQVAWREIAVLGLQDYASRPAGSLAYGLRRRLEIARALTLGPSFLLLDEPAAGMTPVETANLIEILAQTRRDRGLGIVLVEHDMQLVMTLCERLIVLDQGRLIAAGTPREVQGNPSVIAAYLGSRASAKALGLAATRGGTSAQGLSRV